MNGRSEYAPLEYICSYLYVGRMTPERLWVKLSSSYFVFIKTGKSSCRTSMMSVSVGIYTMAVNPSVAFCRARVRSDGLVDDMVVFSCAAKLTWYVEEHCGLGGNITSRLDNGDFVGLIYSLLVLMDYNNRLHSVATSSLCSTWM